MRCGRYVKRSSPQFRKYGEKRLASSAFRGGCSAARGAESFYKVLADHQGTHPGALCTQRRAQRAPRALKNKSLIFEGPYFDMWGAAMRSEGGAATIPEAPFLQSGSVFRCDGACPEARAARAQISRTFLWAWDTVVRRRVEGPTAAPLRVSAASSCLRGLGCVWDGFRPWSRAPGTQSA